MTHLRELRPVTLLASALAALCAWITVLAWSSFTEDPAGFLVPLLGGCVLVAVVGVVLRTLRVPAVPVALAQILAVFLWLDVRLGPGATVLGVPTPTSVRLMLEAIHESGAAAQAFSSPVPASVPQFYPLLIVLGAGVAVLVDFLAVGLHRAPLAGLPLLAAFSAPVGIVDSGVGVLTFAAAALAFVFLIAADESSRLLGWGRLLTPGRGLLDETNPTLGRGSVWSSARKIGLWSTGLAVCVPLFLPTFNGAVLGGGQGGGGEGSGNGVAVANPMADLKRDLFRGVDVPLVTVRTAGPDPSYLRLSVLDEFDGSAWRPARRSIPTSQRADGPVAAAPGLDSTVRVQSYSARLEVTRFLESRWLPTPYPVTSVVAPGDWRYDKSTLDFISAADGQTTAEKDYRLQGLTVSPTAAQLADSFPAPLSVSQPGTQLPRDMSGYVKALARSVVKGKPTRFEQAVALQDWFRERGGFTYDLTRDKGNGTNDLVRFLHPERGGRVGYCEQFAAAMAVMGRSLGIPSRVAVGFLHPDRIDDDTYVFSSHDMHAWPEMYFGGVGWVRFEPTPAARADGVPGYTNEQVPQAPETSSSAPTASDSLARPANRADREAVTAPGASTGGGGPGGSQRGWWLLVALVVCAGLAVTPRTVRRSVSRRRWARADDAGAWVETGWREVRDSAVDLDIAWDDTVSLRAAATRLERSFADPTAGPDPSASDSHRGRDANPAAVAALWRLVALLERHRYARSLPADATTEELVRGDVQLCGAALRAGAGPRRARRATWLPRSVLASPGGRWSTRRGGSRPRRSGGTSEPIGATGIDRAR